MSAYSKLIGIMRAEGAKAADSNVEIATVLSINPLKIRVGEIDLSTNIYINPSLNIDLEPSAIDSEDEVLKGALIKLIEALKLKLNDKVLVKQIGSNFYILNKVVSL